MKHIATMALMLTLGVVGVHAQQRPVKMTFSGSMVATTLNLAPDTITDEEQLAGNGALGQFTFHKLRVDEITPQGFGSCGSGFGPSLRVVPGRSGGVFRFQDGSLLTVTVTEGTLCIDLDHLVGHLSETYQITEGTGRLEGVQGNLTLTGTVRVALVDASGAPKLLTNTGGFEGTLTGAP
jgi:hypothetical protein